MARPSASKPTDAEMEILRIIWKCGSATVRDVHDAFLAANKDTSYSALATTMRTMVEKGSIRIVDPRRPQKFAAAQSRQTTCASIAHDLMRRVFGGSISSLVRSALSGRQYTAREIADLRKLIEQFDSKAGLDARRSVKPDDKPRKQPPR